MRGLDTEGLNDPWQSPRDVLRFAWRQVDTPVHRKLALAAAALSLLSVADFLAVLMIAGVTGLVVASFTQTNPPAMSWLPEEVASPLTAIALVGGGAVVLLSLKTYISWRLIRRVFVFIARLQPAVTARVYATYLSAPYPAAQMLSRSQVAGAMGTGAGSLLSAVRAAIGLIADSCLILLMTVLMLLASPLLFVASAAYFGLLAFVTARLIGRRMSHYGREGFVASLAAGETVQASVGFAPEIRLYGMAEEFSNRLALDQQRASTLSAMQQVLFQAPRYVFEMGVLVGFVVVASIAFVFQSPADAAFTVALFTLSSVRLVPALQRLNGSWGTLRLSTGQSYSLAPILRLPHESENIDATNKVDDYESGPSEVLSLRDVCYRYPETHEWALENVNLVIEEGTMVALVGKTGSGKSTLAGIIAGLMSPTRGSVHRVGGTESRSRLGIVPQDVYLAPDTVRNNIALNVLGEVEDDDQIWWALQMAQVADVVASLPGGLDAELGENGARLSGGESQRIGLARALYRRPELLILDEATSSLDAKTEQLVAEAIRNVSKDCALVVIAHRLATVRNADHVVFLEDGRILAQGTFAGVAARVPAFAEAAALQGLGDLSGEDLTTADSISGNNPGEPMSEGDRMHPANS